MILSICPPHAALDVAAQVAGAGYSGVYVDANAISVATAGQVAGDRHRGGRELRGRRDHRHAARGGRAHPALPVRPARRRGAPLFGRSALDARIADGPPYAASAVKMAYAAWTKGSSALLLAARALARAGGVERTLLAEWALSQPALAAAVGGRAASAAAKGWRWVAEMEEIAASMAAAGLPAGFHQAAADIYDRAAQADAPADPPPNTAPPEEPVSIPWNSVIGSAPGSLS